MRTIYYGLVYHFFHKESLYGYTVLKAYKATVYSEKLAS